MAKIHKTAIIDESCDIHDSVEIGPFCVIGPNVSLGENCILNSHVVIKGPSKFGSGNKFFPFCIVGEDTPDLKFKGENTTLEVGQNNTFREFSKVHRGTKAGISSTKIGNNNLIMPGVMIAHDCILGNNNVLVDNTALAGHVTLKDNITLGGYTLVHQFCQLGSFSFSGMGSHITMDIPAFIRVAGNPTKPAGLNSIALERNAFTKNEISNLKKAYKIFYRDSLGVGDAIQKINNECNLDEHIELFVESIKSSSRGILR